MSLPVQYIAHGRSKLDPATAVFVFQLRFFAIPDPAQFDVDELISNDIPFQGNLLGRPQARLHGKIKIVPVPFPRLLRIRCFRLLIFHRLNGL